MAEFNEVAGAEVSPTGKFQKSWHYTEKTNKHTVHHNISITKERYTHETEIKQASHAMRSRTDISVKDVHSVHTFYGLSRNVGLAVFMWILAALFFIFSITQFMSGSGAEGSRGGDNSGAVFGIILLVVAALFGLIGYLIFRRIKPAFMLEINTVLGLGQIQNNGVAYGSIAAALGASTAKRRGFFAALFAPLRKLFGGKAKYKFEMPPEVGHDIVDTIGPLLIED